MFHPQTTDNIIYIPPNRITNQPEWPTPLPNSRSVRYNDKTKYRISYTFDQTTFGRCMADALFRRSVWVSSAPNLGRKRTMPSKPHLLQDIATSTQVLVPHMPIDIAFQNATQLVCVCVCVCFQAALYQNEVGVGKAVQDSKIPRYDQKLSLPTITTSKIVFPPTQVNFCGCGVILGKKFSSPQSFGLSRLVVRMATSSLWKRRRKASIALAPILISTLFILHIILKYGCL